MTLSKQIPSPSFSFNIISDVKSKENFSVNIDELADKAKDKLEDSKLTEALALYEKILDIDVFNAGAANQLGIIYAYLNDYTKSEIYFNYALHINDKLSASWANKAKLETTKRIILKL